MVFHDRGRVTVSDHSEELLLLLLLLRLFVTRKIPSRRPQMRYPAILLQRGPVDPKFQVEGVVPHQPFFFSVNWAKLSYGI